MQTYHKLEARTGETKQIQLVLGKSSPARSIINEFYTTVIINFIGWNKAYSLFPIHTHLQHTTYACVESMDQYVSTAMQKYIDRGFKPVALAKDISKAISSEERRIGDRHSWEIRFETTGIAPPSIPESLLEFTVFTINKIIPGESPSYYRLNASGDRFSSLALKHTYCFPPFPCGREGFLEYQLAQLTVFELKSMDVTDRPKNFPRLLENYGTGLHPSFPTVSKFAFPKSWHYYDHLLPQIWEVYQNRTMGIISDISLITDST